MNQQILLYPQVIVHRKLPVNYNPKDARLFYPEDFEFTIPEITIDAFENVKLLHQQLFKNNKIVKGYAARSNPALKQQIIQQLKLNLFKPVKLKEVFCGMNQWGNNYFHWVTEVLPLLYAFQKQKPHIPVVLPEAYQTIPFIQQSINALAIKPIWFKGNKVLTAEILYASLLPKVGQYSIPLLQSLAAAFSSSKFSNPYKKVYVSRKKAKRRTISNEESVIKLLLTYGFEIVCFEELSWLQQIELMQETKLLISCHGAGLTNCLFMPSGGTVIELRAANNDYNCFYTLADLSGHQYLFQLCTPLEQNHRDADIEVDLVMLESIAHLSDSKLNHAAKVH